MLDLSLLEQQELQKLCKQPFKNVPIQYITDFATSLFPIKTISDPLDMLYKNMATYYNTRFDKKIDFERTTEQVLAKACSKNKLVFESLQILFNGPFKQRFKKLILKSKGAIKPSIPSDLTNRSLQKAQRSYVCLNNKKTNAKSSSNKKDAIDSKSVFSCSSNGKTNKTFISAHQYLDDIKVSQTGEVTDLKLQKSCLCGQQTSSIDQTTQNVLTCFFCKNKYHAQCMKRQQNSNLCVYCHLKLLMPNFCVRKVLFTGVLNKRRIKHQIPLHLMEQDLEKKFIIQVRCFRLSKDCQNAILFPDCLNLTLKHHSLMSFQPIHVQSSLKYRKDEAFSINSKYLSLKDNRIIGIEKKYDKINKDRRINPAHHLLGIYLVQKKQVTNLVQQITKACFTSFQESKTLIQRNFEQGNLGNEVVCQLLKQPLTCTLTTDKMKLPARGTFCKHFHCFDLANFLSITCGSSNPKWTCPICRKPAFDFRIDIIMFKILESFKKFQQASEVVFLRSGEFKVFESQEKECEHFLNSIYQLDICDKVQRVALQHQKQQSPKPCKRTAPVIEIDQQ